MLKPGSSMTIQRHLHQNLTNTKRRIHRRANPEKGVSSLSYRRHNVKIKTGKTIWAQICAFQLPTPPPTYVSNPPSPLGYLNEAVCCQPYTSLYGSSHTHTPGHQCFACSVYCLILGTPKPTTLSRSCKWPDETMDEVENAISTNNPFTVLPRVTHIFMPMTTAVSR